MNTKTTEQLIEKFRDVFYCKKHPFDSSHVFKEELRGKIHTEFENFLRQEFQTQKEEFIERLYPLFCHDPHCIDGCNKIGGWRIVMDALSNPVSSSDDGE